MAKTLNTDDLRAAAGYLSEYIGEVQNLVQQMNDAATDCSDNMGTDTLSAQAISEVRECTKGISATLEDASSLKNKILQKADEIDKLKLK